MNVFAFVLALVGMVLLFFYSMARAGVRRCDQRYGEEETELMQELNRGLLRMEQRVEALETLLLERAERPQPAERF